ncbi:ERF family protein [Pseudomonas syringae]|uniref:ERF family protein n=1 Tax=Pseudomonas syringae TaxID=317 RepID=UPI00041C814D|nr:ERF family protein [Pseudomonas syringae]
MSVYKKLQEARCEMQRMTLTKSGENKFAKYFYFELGDFLPVINDIFREKGLCGVISFTAELATLRVVDVDDGTSIEFTSPMGKADLKGCHEVQNIGAVETYQRRYLYVTALEIVEHDALDSITGAAQQQGRQQRQADYNWTALVADIAKASSIEALKTAFEVAIAAAKAAGNSNMSATFTKAKDKRKLELTPQGESA